MKKISIFLFFILLGLGSLMAQFNLKNQIPQAKKYMPEEVIDSVYGIQLYEKLNNNLRGDSMRNCKGYACSGWVEDYYENKQLLHRGYYVNGQLKIYKNYYPDGKLEREFRLIDDYKSEMKKYYPNGNLKSYVKYVEGEPLKWEDYYMNGQLDYFEEYHRSFEFHIAIKSYREDGTPENVMELIKKKKLLYSKKEYYENGQLKEEGEVEYSRNMLDYQRTGKWLIYNESGNPTKQLTYDKGKVEKEKAL